MLIDAACQSAVPLLFRHVLNELQNDPQVFLDTQLWQTLIYAIGLAIMFVPAAYVGHAFSHIATAHLLQNLRIQLYQHVQILSADFHQRHLVGESSSRLNGDLDQIGQSTGACIGIIWALFSVAYSLIMMVWIDLGLSVLLIGIFVLSSFVTIRFLPKIRRMARDVRDRAGEASGVVTEFLSVQPLIKSFTYEEKAKKRVTATAIQLRQSHEYLAWRQGIFNDGMQTLLKFIAPISLLLIGAVLVAQGSLLIGDLVAFWGFWMLLTHALALICGMLPNVMIGLAAADRVTEWLNERPLVADHPNAVTLVSTRGELNFTDVSFRYPANNRGNTNLRDFSLHIRPGQTIALVGPSGAGKSTILQLVLRFYDPDHGKITIDGKPLTSYTQQSLRKHIGIVFQENIFLAGSLADNLRVAKHDATEEEMIAALQTANAWEFIANFPDGLNTLLGERGTSLSGGQKQRLAIARMFLKDPAIILLDEATAALDARSEELVVAALDHLLEDRTAIIVAHRINTIRDADCIIVIDDGRPIAQGSHCELRQKNQLYAQFCEQQRVA